MAISYIKNYLLASMILSLGTILSSYVIATDEPKIVPTGTHINNEHHLELNVFAHYPNLNLKITADNDKKKFPASYDSKDSKRNVLEAPHNYNIILEDNEATDGRLISHNKTPALTIDLYPSSDEAQDITIRPHITGQDCGLQIKSNNNNYAHENILLETSKINAKGTAVELTNKVKSLKFVGSDIGNTTAKTNTASINNPLINPKIGLHVIQDNNTNSSDIYCWSQIKADNPIRLDGDNYTVDIRSNIETSGKDDSAILITGKNNTILLENEALITSNSSHFKLDKEAENNTIEINQNRPLSYNIQHDSTKENLIKIYSQGNTEKNSDSTKHLIEVNQGKLNIVNNGTIISDITVANGSSLNLRNDKNLDNKKFNIEGNVELTNNGTLSSVINIAEGGVLSLTNDKEINENLIINVTGKLDLINDGEFTGIINIIDGGIINIRNDQTINIVTTKSEDKSNSSTGNNQNLSSDTPAEQDSKKTITIKSTSETSNIINNETLVNNILVEKGARLKLTNDDKIQGSITIQGTAEIVNNGNIEQIITTDIGSSLTLRNDETLSNKLTINGTAEIVNNGEIKQIITADSKSSLILRNDKNINEELIIKGTANIVNNGDIKKQITTDESSNLVLRNDKNIHQDLNIKGKANIVNNGEIGGTITTEAKSDLTLRNDNILNKDIIIAEIAKVTNNGTIENNNIELQEGSTLELRNDILLNSNINVDNSTLTLINDGEITDKLDANYTKKKTIKIANNSKSTIRNDKIINNIPIKVESSKLYLINNGNIDNDITVDFDSEATLKNDGTLNSTITVNKSKLDLVNNGSLEIKPITITDSIVTIRNDKIMNKTPINIYGKSKVEIINNGAFDINHLFIDENSEADVIINNDVKIIEDTSVNYEKVLASNDNTTKKPVQHIKHKGTIEIKNHGDTENPLDLDNTGRTKLRNYNKINKNINSKSNLILNNISTGVIEGEINSSGNSELLNSGKIHNNINLEINDDTKENVVVENNDYIEGNIKFSINKNSNKRISSTNKGERIPGDNSNFIGWHNGNIDVEYDKGTGQPLARKIVHLKNKGGVITGNIGNANNNNIIVENADEGYWGTIKAEDIYADSIVNKDYSIILSNNKTKTKSLTNGKKSIAKFKELEIDTELANNDKVTTHIENTATLFAETIKASDNSQIKIKLNENSIIAASAITNAEIENTNNTKLFIYSDIDIINDNSNNNSNNIKLKNNINNGCLVAQNITLHTNINNENCLIAQSISGSNINSLYEIENKGKLICNQLKDIRIVSSGIINIKRKISPDIEEKDIIEYGYADQALTAWATINDTLEDIKKQESKVKKSNKLGIPTKADLEEIYAKITEKNQNLNTTNQLYCKGKVEIAFVEDNSNINSNNLANDDVVVIYNAPKSKCSFTDGIFITTDETTTKTEVFLYKLDSTNMQEKLPLSPNMVTGKITNNNGSLKLIAGSYLDKYDDVDDARITKDKSNRGKIIIEVNENLTNFSTNTDRALLYVDEASLNAINNSNIELILKKGLQKNKPGKYSIRVVSANRINIDGNLKDDNREESEENATNISDNSVIDSGGSYKLVNHRVKPKQQKSTATNQQPINAAMSNSAVGSEALEDYTERQLSAEAHDNGWELLFDLMIQADPTDPPVTDPTDPSEPTKPEPPIKKSTREIDTHRQVQRLVSSYLYKYSCLSCNYQPQLSCLVPEKQSVWVKTALGHMKQSASANCYQYTSNIKSLLIGADHRRDKTTLGVAVAINDIDTSATSKADHATTNSYSLILYANHLKQNWFINLQLSHDTARHNLTSTDYTSLLKYNSYANNFQAIIGSCWYKGQIQINPIASLRLGNIKLNGYSVTDNKANTFNIANSSYNYADIGAGAAIQKQFHYSNMLVNLHSNLMVYRILTADSWNYNYQITTYNKNVKIDNINKYYYELDFGIDFNGYNNWSLSLELLYNWANKYEATVVNLLLRYSF